MRTPTEGGPPSGLPGGRALGCRRRELWNYSSGRRESGRDDAGGTGRGLRGGVEGPGWAAAEQGAPTATGLPVQRCRRPAPPVANRAAAGTPLPGPGTPRPGPAQAPPPAAPPNRWAVGESVTGAALLCKYKGGKRRPGSAGGREQQRVERRVGAAWEPQPKRAGTRERGVAAPA